MEMMRGENLGSITLVVERELREIDKNDTLASGFVYCVNVHSKFSRPSKKGHSALGDNNANTSTSIIRIRGPYARTIESAISALESDLVRKMRVRATDLSKVTDDDWIRDVLIQERDDVLQYPILPHATWVGVNFKLAPKQAATGEAAEEDIGCCGGLVKAI